MNVEPIMLQKRFINPYRARIHEFRGRIFDFDNGSDDLALRSEILARSEECFIEIGSGSGQHLIELARRQPRASYWGFEIRYKRSVRTIEKAFMAGVPNVYVLRTSAEQGDKIFAPHSISGIYVNFPDPWDRPRERKHRILSESFLNQIASLLKSNGFLSVKTDHRDYFLSFKDILASDARFRLVEQSADLTNSEFSNGNIITEFESLFVRQNLPIFYLKAACL